MKIHVYMYLKSKKKQVLSNFGIRRYSCCFFLVLFFKKISTDKIGDNNLFQYTYSPFPGTGFAVVKVVRS